MALAVALFGCFAMVLGLTGLVAPQRLLALVTRAQSRLGLHLIAGFRLLLGIAFLLAAPTSRAVLYLQLLGVLSILSGLVTPFVGERRFEAILGWWQQRSSWAVRGWSAFVWLFGLSLVWAVLPPGSVAGLDGAG